MQLRSAPEQRRCISPSARWIGEGDEVIVPSFTFIAVANSVCYERATPVFVDIDPITLNMDPASVEAAITPRTRPSSSS